MDKLSDLKCIERAGHLFMLTIWVESMLIKALLFKKADTNDEFAKTIIEYNEKYGFERILKMFKMEFESVLSPADIELLEECYVFRDAWAHMMILSTLDPVTFVHRPNSLSREKKKDILERMMGGKKINDRIVNFAFDQSEYERYLKIFDEIDSKVLEKVYKTLEPKRNYKLYR
jgi:hypothetical protein